MKRYGWNKHTLVPFPESFPYIEHLEHYSDTRRLNSSEMAEDESSERANLALLSS